MYMHVCIYVYIRTFFMVSVVDIIQHYFLWFLSSVFFFMVSVVAGNICLWFPSLVLYGVHRGRKMFVYGFRRRMFEDFAVAGGLTLLERIQ